MNMGESEIYTHDHIAQSRNQTTKSTMNPLRSTDRFSSDDVTLNIVSENCKAEG